jgi:hypothetical protein
MSVAKCVKPNIIKVNAPEDIAMTALEGFARQCQKAISERGVFRLAISGGATPMRFSHFLVRLILAEISNGIRSRSSGWMSDALNLMPRPAIMLWQPAPFSIR